MKRQKNYSQLKKQEKTPEKINNEREINNLPEKELKTLVIKMLTELGKGVELNTDHFNKELENTKKTQSKIVNPISEIKSPLETMNSRLNGTE